MREMRACAETGAPVSREMALAILASRADELPDILAAASAARRRRFGNAVHLCSILNAKCGACAEDCAFCAQSARHGAAVAEFDLKTPEEMVRAYEEAAERPIRHFSVVTSGNALSDREVEQVCAAVRARRIPGVSWCASLGSVGARHLRALKEAGVIRYHHNLETAESFFPSVCTTHSWRDRRDTVRAAMEAGLEVCSGGLFGLGESPEQRVELAMTLAEEKVDSIPLNFLIPIQGTPLERRDPLRPLEILRIIAMFRLTNPRAEIRLCGGRTHLGELQPLAFLAGATGMMVGPLLTVAGRDVEQDLRMLDQIEVEYARRGVD